MGVEEVADYGELSVALEKFLEAYGVHLDPEGMEFLIEAITSVRPQYITTEQIATVTGQAPKMVSTWCSRFHVPRKTMASLSKVMEAKQSMRGQGWRRGQRG